MDTHIKGPAENGQGAIPGMRALRTLFSKAFSTLTSNNTNVADGATVTIGTKVYTFKTALTPTEGEVLIGADADASLLNLIRAINHSGTPGTDYSVAAANPDVTAATAVTAHAFQVRATANGALGNLVATSETSATLSWTGAYLAGGLERSTAAGDRILLKTIGASVTTPLLVELLEVLKTAFNGTSPVVSIFSTNLDGSGGTTEIAIADIVTDGPFETRLIYQDKIYYVRYTAATGVPTAGEIWSFARVASIGYTS